MAARLGPRMTRRSLRRAARRRTASNAALEAVRHLAHVYTVEIADTADLETAISELRADPHVAFVQRDHRNRLDFDPNDPFLSSVGSWSQPYSDLWGLERIGALEAWQTTRGEGQIVAVVDTGLDYEHPDIEANVWVNPGEDLDRNGRVDAGDFNGIDDDGNGFVDDIHGYDFVGFGDLLSDGEIHLGDPDPFDDLGHGTHVAGIIAATANNGIGIAGLAPEARIMPLKGFDADGFGRDTDLWRAVLYAIENGANVVNASWSCAPACAQNPLALAVLAIAEAAGVVFVTSAGNGSIDVIGNAPENSRAAITVGSIGFDDLLSSFSNRGWLIDLLAPGGGPQTPSSVFIAKRNILSLAATSLAEFEEAFVIGGGYWRLAGTSMAAPHVAGAVALLRSVRPDLDVTQIRRLLRIAAEDLGPLGHDPIYGAGLLDLPALLTAELPDLELTIQTPAPGQIFDPSEGAVALQLVARGRDLSSYSIAYSRGLDTDEFDEIETGYSLDGVAAVPWSVDDLSDGPYVLRLRAILHSGRIIDEFGILALERNSPRRLSGADDHENQPSISGRDVVWRVRACRSCAVPGNDCCID
jgi:subtilisin family serine protease